MRSTYIFLLCLSLGYISVGPVRSARTLPHVERYDVVRPHRLDGRVRRSLSSNQVYPDEIRYALTIDGGNHTIHLERNRNLIGKDYTETHYLEDGSRVTASPNYEDHCYYHGHIQGVEDSSVSVGICSGISGFVRARQQVYLIEPLEDSDEGEHAFYKQEHLTTNSSRCGLSTSTPLNDHDHNHDHDRYDDDPAPKVSALFKSRSWKSQGITGPQRFVEMYLVVDNAEYKRYQDQTKARMLGIANHVDKLYRPLNVRVMLVGLEIWTTRNLIDVSTNSEKTLDRFLVWRQNDLLKREKHDNAQFVTGIDFDGDTVGLANKFAMCTGSSGGVNQDHNEKNHLGLASTIAHEMGHNFGMSHDSPSCTCITSSKSSNCVMTDKISPRSIYPESFSICSQEQFQVFLERAQPSCLLNRPSSDRLYVGPSCGNSFLDPGEECDCGTVEECNNPCCDATTCRLTSGSRCAHGECCENCQFKQEAVMCRASASGCDLPEACTGISEYCPEDVFEMNGTPCDHDEGYCYNGQCPTHQKHCRRLFGQAAKVAEDNCFGLNINGKNGSHCGITRDGNFTRCAKTNVKCGSIFCASNEDSITGKKAIFTMFWGTCLVAVDDDRNRNLDMVPTGTKCGPSKVCYDNKCLGVSMYGVKEQCSKKCNNNGVCNHKRECHCNPGWAPPYCEARYSNLPQGQSGVIAGVSTAIAVLLLLTLVIGGLMCWKKVKRDNYASKRKVYSTPGQLNPMFQEGSDKTKPVNKGLISVPTLMESSATQACTPLFVHVSPTRPPPQPPKKLPAEQSSTEPTQPLPPSKPLPPVNKMQYTASKPSPPPAPPVKPSAPPIPPVKPSAPPVPPVKPSAPPVPPVKPIAPPLPPVKPMSSPAKPRPPVPPVKPKTLKTQEIP